MLIEHAFNVPAYFAAKGVGFQNVGVTYCLSADVKLRRELTHRLAMPALVSGCQLALSRTSKFAKSKDTSPCRAAPLLSARVEFSYFPQRHTTVPCRVPSETANGQLSIAHHR